MNLKKINSVLFGLLIYSFGITSSANANEKVTLQLKWKHQFQFAGYYMAKEMGFYESVGLDVSILEAQPGIKPIEEVLNNKADFGVGTSDIVLYRAEGKPVVVLGVIFQHSPSAIAVKQASEILNLQDIAQMSLMIEPHAADIWAYFESEAIDITSLNILEHSFEYKDLIDGKTQGMSVYITDELYNLKNEGFNFQLFYPRSAGIDFYGDNLFTTESMIKRKPEIVDDFLKASKAGWIYAMEHKEETAKLIFTRYSQRHTIDHLLFEAEQMDSLVQATIVEPGYMNSGRWNYIIDSYIHLGLLKNRPSLDKFLYTNKVESNLSELYKLIFTVSIIVTALTILLSRFIWINSQLKKEIVLRKKIENELRSSTNDLENAKHIAEQANEFKSRFLAIVGHDLKTPLTAILGFSEQALIHFKQGISNEAELQMIIKNSRYIKQMLGELSDLSQVESKTLEVKPLMVNLLSLLLEITASAKNEATIKNIEFKQNFNWPLPKFVYLDATRFRQILNNLISNAMKFTDNGTVELNITLKNQHLFLEVKDTGIGIEDTQLTELFKPFQQMHNNIKSNFGGTGLGLYISKELVNKMGGIIGVNSKLGVGSTFYFQIPLGIDKPELANQMDLETSETQMVFSINPAIKGRILLAEDVEDNIKLIGLLLKSPNIHLDVVENGQLALDIIKEENYDLILMDIQMPVMSGTDALNSLRQENNNTPVIALTALATQEIKQSYLDMGFDGVLDKPIERKVFIELIESYLNINEETILVSINQADSENESKNISDLKKEFQARLPEYLRELEEMSTTENFESLAKASHRLIGSSGNLFSMEMSQLLKELELNAKNKNLQTCMHLIEQIKNLVKN